MGRTFDLGGNDEEITFNIGDESLCFRSTDERLKSMTEQASDLKAKAETIDDSDEWKARSELKALLDEFFEIMFDETAPQKIYVAAGENAMAYLKVFLKIADALQETKAEKENDAIFKKYLAE
ncbi:hypothetical protein Javan88_0048 [Streptococcus phage Javan88]|uniref:hypothetical protein n=1 Tax=Streptococcus canis TaxID=1329 RepID=UPI0010C4F89C|nr:hypothetical protein Javan91_0045 [Streptococcus phage Javan91]QBX31983.1 hypothetical protein Javan88_0048 [Streptococcus phage Javan88]